MKKTTQTPMQLPRDEAELTDLVLRCVRLAHEQTLAEATLRSAVQAVSAAHSPGIASLETQRKEAEETLRAWSAANAPRFDGARSLVVAGYRFGFRLGNWVVKATKGTTAKSIINALLAMGEEGERWVRVEAELNKVTLLDARTDEAAQAILRPLGVRYEQAEAFSINPDKLEGQS